jgi:4-hydroxybenzoate polyprenyltransferase
MVLLALAAFAILATFNGFAILIGIAALGPVVVYPFMKRITWWPQVFLGLAFNWGALLGWAAVRGDLGWPPLVMYLGGIAWTLGYDTIYAHQDKEDDALVGIKSSARRLGRDTRPALWGFYAVALALLVAAIALTRPSPWAGPLLALAAAQLAWQAARVDLNDPASCLRAFRSNHLFGALLFAAIVAGRVAG